MKFSGILFLMFFCLHGFAQESLSKRLRNLQKNSIPKEKVFIHTNKTSYFQEDVIWFKAYVANTVNHPSVQTTNLNVNLLDHKGVVIYSRILFIENGMGLGQFELSKTVSPGSYYIQAYTNFMRNFGNDYHYLQKIEVRDDSFAQVIVPTQNQYDIQILPEGGYLLEGIENVLGIKVLVNGSGRNYEGHVLNSRGKSIVSFKSQHLGMSKFTFLYRNDEKYTAEILLKDTLLTVEVPKAQRKGIALHLDNTEKNYLNIHLKTNEETFNDEIFSKYSLLFHQNHQISDLFSLSRFDSLNGLIQIKKNLFFDGVNTVTLFKKESPIAERKFFIEPKEKQTENQIQKLDSENDSIAYNLVLRSREKALESDLSISILSADSQLYKEKQNIKTAFLLTPFLEGYVENPSYYFDKKNLKRLEDLDILLLTQGWTQYNLPEMIAKLNPKPLYEFEYGFDLKGRLDAPVEHDSIVLIQDDFQIVEKVSLKDGYSFSFNNLLLHKEDTTKIAFIDKLGKVVRPKKIIYDSLERKDISPTKTTFTKKYSISAKTPQQDFNSSEELIPKSQKGRTTSITPDGTIALEEAIIIEKKRSKRYFERKKIIEKYKPVVFDIGRYYNIPIPEVFMKYNHEFLEYLKSQGVREVRDNPADIYYVDPASREVIVQIDGRTVHPQELSGLILRMQDIENVLVSSEGNINGKLVFGSIYQVFTKEKYGKPATSLFNKYRVENGFDRPEKYYSPIYHKDLKGITELNEIDWKPLIKTNSKGEANFKIAKNRKMGKLLFSIQGFSKKGHLISETILVE